MSLTVNAPFLKFYNLCYLMNRSTGCSVRFDNRPGGRSHESLTWAEKRWSLPYVTVFLFPTQLQTVVCFKFSQTGILWPILKLTLHKHENLWLFLNLTRRFLPPQCWHSWTVPQPLSSWGCSSFQQRGRSTNPKLGKSPSASGEFWKTLWGLGNTHVLHVWTCWSASSTQTVRKTVTNVLIMKMGGGVFFF